MKRTLRAIPLILVAALSANICAQKIGETPSKTPTKLKKVAFMPLMFWEVDKGEREYKLSAKDKYEKQLYEIFEKLGIARIEQATVNNSWRDVSGSTFDTAKFTMPDEKKLVEMGKRLKVDYVVASRCHWLVRSPWVNLGPKTKAIASVDIWIIDVAKSEFARKAEGITANNEEKTPAWKWAVDLFIFPMSPFGGGPKTPKEERSSLVALGKALQPWLDTVYRGSVKIGEGG